MRPATLNGARPLLGNMCERLQNPLPLQVTGLRRLCRSTYRKDLIAVYLAWFTFLRNTMRENAHGETDPR